MASGGGVMDAGSPVCKDHIPGSICLNARVVNQGHSSLLGFFCMAVLIGKVWPHSVLCSAPIHKTLFKCSLGILKKKTTGTFLLLISWHKMTSSNNLV